MREVTIEFDNWDCPSNNQVRSMNTHVYRRLIEDLKKKILIQIGEGPWPKVTFGPKDFPANVKKAVREQLQATWPKRRMVMADITIRRNRIIDKANSAGGTRPILDSMVRMGWLVDDHKIWVSVIHRDQVIGDPKAIISILIPETDREERRILENVQNGN